MKTIALDLYSFSELNEKAREKALAEYADINVDYGWWDFVYDDFIAICKTLGISVDTTQMHFSGFYSQGDGSAFEATAYLPALAEGIEKQSWKSYAPHIELDLPTCPTDRRVLKLMETEALDISPRIRQPHRGYYVKGELNEVYPWNDHKHDLIEAELEKTEEWFTEVAEMLNHYLYKALRDDYEYQVTEDAVAEAIEANDYLFTADGRNANRISQLANNEI
jgi:hypothetical protein